MAEERREVTLPNGDEIFIRLPGMADHEEAEWEYARIFNKAIKNGIVPREVMRQQLRDQGIWTEDDDAHSEKLEEDIAYAMAKLQEAADSDDEDGMEKARREVTRLRNEFMAHNSRLNSFMNNCAEEKASEARLLYLTYACSETRDGKRYWKSYEAFKSDKNPAVVNTAFYGFMLFINGLSSNIVDSLPENQVVLKSKRAVADALDKAEQSADKS